MARVQLPDGRKLMAQVDGGTGHSGRRSPEIHFGLGACEKSKQLAVEIEWRNRAGQVQRQALQLLPSWHNIQLRASEAFVQTTSNPLPLGRAELHPTAGSTLFGQANFSTTQSGQ